MLKSVATQTDANVLAVPVPDVSTLQFDGRPSRTPNSRRHSSPSAEAKPAPGFQGADSQLSRPNITATSSERFSIWKDFTEQHTDLVGKRVKADDHRRRARFARQRFMKSASLLEAMLEAASSSVRGPLLQQVKLVRSDFLETEATHRDVEHLEDGLVQAETTISKTIPRVLGPDNWKTFQMLEDQQLLLRPPSAPSTDSRNSDRLPEQELTSEQSQYYAMLDKVDLLEEQVLELRIYKEGFKEQNEADLDQKSKTFLQDYDEQHQQLTRELKVAKAELELAKDVLQALPVSEDEGGYSEVPSPHAQRSAPSSTVDLPQDSFG